MKTPDGEDAHLAIGPVVESRPDMYKPSTDRARFPEASGKVPFKWQPWGVPRDSDM